MYGPGVVESVSEGVQVGSRGTRNKFKHNAGINYEKIIWGPDIREAWTHMCYIFS